jgi:hypothetical protein
VITSDRSRCRRVANDKLRNGALLAPGSAFSGAGPHAAPGWIADDVMSWTRTWTQASDLGAEMNGGRRASVDPPAPVTTVGGELEIGWDIPVALSASEVAL